ncbi:hypothetical protein SNOG_09175 [Parastagonospora nodorum SN15]|uniref:Uncharacterized protein n=1 Tax=Phaeosphaeria nodorum (strain SN15 / ATCC MYA-4574 / FGSC 10173) TaxID=321614 RepID=Q0UGD9_PHANO|nr:hypothetical protein SNOG_09175 [Parastagonospora nodorum SN15]EAT83367.1 hypothetical protein SNOG_09175 [Parastagonospora nodorum SN15]
MTAREPHWAMLHHGSVLEQTVSYRLVRRKAERAVRVWHRAACEEWVASVGGFSVGQVWAGEDWLVKRLDGPTRAGPWQQSGSVRQARLSSRLPSTATAAGTSRRGQRLSLTSLLSSSPTPGPPGTPHDVVFP